MRFITDNRATFPANLKVRLFDFMGNVVTVKGTIAATKVARDMVMKGGADMVSATVDKTYGPDETNELFKFVSEREYKSIQEMRLANAALFAS